MAAEAAAQLEARLRLMHEQADQLSAGELEQLIRPVILAVRRRLLVNRLFYMGKWFVAVLVVTFLTASLCSLVCVRETAFAVTRLALIKLLVVWDWRDSGYRSCLLSNPLFVEPPVRALDHDTCQMCESLEEIEVVGSLSRLAALHEYLELELPVIVNDAMNDWPVASWSNFSRFHFMQLLADDIQEGYHSCRLKTNLRARNDMRVLFGKMAHPSVKKWYAQWENCRKTAAKSLRVIYHRPYFLPSIVENTNYNFVLISSNYTGRVYKEMPLSGDVTWVAQIYGSVSLRFSPRYPCQHHCLELTTVLPAGHIVLFSDFLWEVDYLPGYGTENLAIGVSGFWE